MDAERLLHTLIRHEGIKYKPYRCTAGKLTIGVGRNIEDVGISESEAMHMLKNDVAVVAAQCMGSFEWYLTWGCLSLNSLKRLYRTSSLGISRRLEPSC